MPAGFSSVKLMLVHISTADSHGGARRVKRLALHSSSFADAFTYVEVWGFEPQTYGLQSHRSSQLSYTPGLANLTVFSHVGRCAASGVSIRAEKRKKGEVAHPRYAWMRSDRNRGCE